MARILIIEDEADIVLSLGADLRRQGYDVGVASDGVQGLAMASSEAWDLILLDVMLPKMDGFDVCAALRRGGIETPVIMLTARTQDAEKEIGLDAGADDYVTKPFSLRELRARVRARLRRAPVDALGTWSFGPCEVDFTRAELRRDGALVEMTAHELKLLEIFYRHRGRVLSRDRLIETAWGRGVAVTDRVVDTHVFNLRKKIEPEPAAPRFLVSVRGVGYRFDG
jgi:DNA-binding response OmpR family regulator